MTLNWYCPNCEVRIDAHRNDLDMSWTVECSMCSMGMKVSVYRSPEKDYEQVTLDFNNIPLTDSQRGYKQRHTSQVRKKT